MSRAKKLAYLTIGTVSLALGVIGIILPVLPTTPFILLTGYCYYRGSDRLHQWLINHPTLGPIVEEYGDGEGMTKQSKQKAITMTWVAVILTAVFLIDTLRMRVILIAIACIGTVVILKLKTRSN